MVVQKKKAEQVEVLLVQSPPEYITLATFHIPLKSFAEADLTPVVMTLNKDHPPPPPVSPTTDLTVRILLVSVEVFIKKKLESRVARWCSA